MVHVSKRSPPQFSGAPSVWGERFGSWVAAEWVKSQSLARIVVRHPITKRQTLIIPEIEPGGRKVKLVAFYSLLPASLDLESLEPDQLTDDGWRKFARAFVAVSYDPDFQVVNHDGSIRATLKLLDVWSPRAPSPAEVDKAFSTRLQERIDRAARHVSRIVHAI